MNDLNLIKDAITHYYGDECTDFVPDCICCRVWNIYKMLVDDNGSFTAWKKLDTKNTQYNKLDVGYEFIIYNEETYEELYRISWLAILD